ncbi:hypothetical protein HDU92_006380 [Lobulomyces angularis]|nr:hypothetical protein HDU92_006380 [Lobulomyces angularis]
MTKTLLEKYHNFEELKKDAVLGWNQTADHNYWIPSSDIIGKLPDEMNGTFFRNGPGMSEVFGTKLKHPIDGDGMIAALSFSGGKVHLRNKFVDTWQHHEEQTQRYFKFRGQMGTATNDIVSKDALNLATSLATRSKTKLQPFRDPSNTNVFYWGGKLLSSYETMLPHSIDPTNLNTLGPDDLNETLKIPAFSAHFRVDPILKRLVTLSLKPETPSLPGKNGALPILQMNEYDEDWKLMQTQIHNIPGLNYSHDFLLTEHFYVLHMTPFVKTSATLFIQIALGLKSPGDAMKHYPECPSNFVVIERKQNPKVYFFKTGRFHIFHFGNISEVKVSSDEYLLEFNAVCLGDNAIEKFNMSFDQGLWLANGSECPGHLLEFRLTVPLKVNPKKDNGDMKLFDCHQFLAEDSNNEFPIGHPWRNGMKNRYTYLMSTVDKLHPIPFTDIIKYDSLTKTKKIWFSYGIVGEPCFVPRKKTFGVAVNKELIPDEDDGWILVQLYLPEKRKTEFVILDAKCIEKGPICTIRLKHHLPFSFHGTWCEKTFVNQSNL